MQSSVERLAGLLRDAGLKLVTAESCTGGGLAALITDLPGTSDIFERGFVTYSNESKQDLLGVPADTIARHGAVSRETAQAMVTGALNNSRADIAVSITGIAGPSGGTKDKPVGLVYIGHGRTNGLVHVTEYRFKGGRISVRQQSVEIALNILIEFV